MGGGEDDNEEAMVGRALTYLVLYSTLGMIVSIPPPVPLPMMQEVSDYIDGSYDGAMVFIYSNNLMS